MCGFCNNSNKELEQIPGLIAEAKRAVPAIAEGVTAESVSANIAALERQIARLTEEKAAASTGTAAGSAVRESIARLRAQIAEGRAKHMDEQNSLLSDWNKSLIGAQNEAAAHRMARDIAEADLQLARAERDRLNRAREKLVAEYKEAAAQKWTDEAAICPTCGQPFPADRVERMKAEFNQRRSDCLTEINRRGQTECSKDMIADCDAEIARLEELAQAEETQVKEAENRVSALLREQPPAVPYENTPDYQALNRQIESFERRADNQGEAVQAAVSAVEGKLAGARAALKAEQEKQANLATAEAQRERIAELEQREKDFGRMYEETEKGLHLCSLFIKAKVRMLTERINGKFRSVRFRLFVEQVNGGIKDDCEVLVPGEGGALVPWRDANNAARINAGLEIIEALSNHWNTYMPVFIDNAESVTHLMRTETQTIRLVVSEPDKQLRMELESAA